MALTAWMVTHRYPEFAYARSAQSWGPRNQTSNLAGIHDRMRRGEAAMTGKLRRLCETPLDRVLESIHSGTI